MTFTLWRPGYFHPRDDNGVATDALGTSPGA
jgi:hypothetical protein